MSVLTKKLTKIDKELLVLEKNVYILQRILVLAGSITYQQSPVSVFIILCHHTFYLNKPGSGLKIWLSS